MPETKLKMKIQNIYQGAYYRYSMPLLHETINVANTAGDKYKCKLHYAIKANNESVILNTISNSSMGADCVTANEIQHALEHGFAPDQIVFAGSGKTMREINYATSKNIAVIHCESLQEFELIKESTTENNSTTNIALRINPEFKVDTHEKISTGEKQHKFGLLWDEALELVENNTDIIGFHFHVGSQILDLSYFEELSLKIRELLSTLPEEFNLQYLNLGGGLGINYVQPERYSIPDFDGWMKAIRTHLPESYISEIHLEPGRSIVAQCGELVCEVQYIKERGTTNLAILDVGMSEILRPALYGAYHKISSNSCSFETTQYTISGPSCESSDTFGDNYHLPRLVRGDILTIHSVGAYGTSMRLGYNLREALPSVYLNKKGETTFKSKRKLAI